MGKLSLLGNVLDHWELMANDTKSQLRELEPAFCSAMDDLYEQLANTGTANTE